MQITFLSIDFARIEPFLKFQYSQYQANASAQFRALDFNNAQQLEEIHTCCQSWEELRQKNEFATRYNDSQAFLRTLAHYKSGDREVPFAVLFSNAQTQACVVGWLEQRSVSYALGPLKFKSLKMRCIKLPETAILCDDQPETWGAITAYFQALLKYVDYLEVPNLLRSHQMFQHITGLVSSHGSYVLEPKVRWRTQLLEPTTGKPLQHRSSKTRSNLRRKEKRLAEEVGSLQLVKVQAKPQVDEFLDHALEIASQTYQAALADVGVSDTQEYRTFLHIMAQEGMLRGYLLMAGSTPIAYVLGDVCFKTFTLWATSFVPQYSQRSPGIVMMCKVQEDLAKEGIVMFDFGWGDAEYKRVLSSEKQDEADIRIYAHRLKPTLAYWMDRSLSNLQRQLKAMLQSTGLFHRAREYWRAWLQGNQQKTAVNS